MKNLILTKDSKFNDLKALAGGKGLNLAKISFITPHVSPFIIIGQNFLQTYKDESQFNFNFTGSDIAAYSKEIHSFFSKNEIPSKLMGEVQQSLKEQGLLETNLAVRSSGLDEDSQENSFAGMFSSYLYQRSLQDINLSIRMCWASAYSERALNYRLQNGFSLNSIKMGVVIQQMVDSEKSGVMFTRNPVDPLDREMLLIDSVYGQGEGLVSGLLDADNFQCSRYDFSIKENINLKEKKLIQEGALAQLHEVAVHESLHNRPSLSKEEILRIAKEGIQLESEYKVPLDIEWAINEGKLYILQVRPITNLPVESFYDKESNGNEATLWDNSNIVESFSGVTLPLTYSGTAKSYAIVYRQTLRVIGVPEKIITLFDDQFENMLGYIRGRVYYNLLNWYKVLFLLPGSANNKDFMETMMGVKEDLHEDHQKLFNFVDSIPKYTFLENLKISFNLIWKYLTFEKRREKFVKKFDSIYKEYNHTDFQKISLKGLVSYFKRWNQEIIYNWETPILNDIFCMIFFGLLKKLTKKWLPSGTDSDSLQNDLLCGEGGLESTMPTKTLMMIAAQIDQNKEQRDFVLNTKVEGFYDLLEENSQHEIKALLDDYLYKYGFRCNDEQKLEEKDLTEDPTFIIGILKSYLKMKNYSIKDMEVREKKIRSEAETKLNTHLKGFKKFIFTLVLKGTRRAVKNRENLRFLRTKSFGVLRKVFRAMASHFKKLELIEQEEDFYYLHLDEVFDFIRGSAVSNNLKGVIKARKEEFKVYKETNDPPERFITYGSAGMSIMKNNILDSGDLLKNQARVSDDPNVLLGVSCCPGIVKGKVRVAKTIEEAQELEGEILVTTRTDPGWVPLYPSCSGLIIERGSLLSHSAVVARELGLPTIVGVSGGLMKRLKTGDEVELNATKGEIRILNV